MDRLPNESDQPLDRLFKLLPAESTAAFLLLRAQFPYESEDLTGQSNVIFFTFVFVIFVATPFLLSNIWGSRDRKTISFVTATFVIWLANIDIERIHAIGEHLKSLDYMIVSSILGVMLDKQFIQGLLIVWAIVLLPLIIPRKITEEHESYKDGVDAHPLGDKNAKKID